MRNRRIVALTKVDCLLLPKLWLFQRNTANIWTRIQHYLEKKVFLYLFYHLTCYYIKLYIYSLEFGPMNILHIYFIISLLTTGIINHYYKLKSIFSMH